MIKRPPINLLNDFDVNYKKDTPFASNARLLQSIWRVKKGYPKNNVKKSNYGNFIETKFAKDKKVNFLTPTIRKLVSEKVPEIRSMGGMVGEPRIWNNLLSSQPLCFNLFGELYYNLELASKIFKKLIDNTINEVTAIKFEYSKRRGMPDHSAFDVFIEYNDNWANKCFLGIEVKYQENLREESQSKAKSIFNEHKYNYVKIADKSMVFKTNVVEILSKPPLFQIWRDHLLMFNMAKDYHDSMFVYLYPFENTECHNGVNNYKKYLVSNDPRKSRFKQIDLKVFINTLNKLVNANWAKELEERYIGTK